MLLQPGPHTPSRSQLVWPPHPQISRDPWHKPPLNFQLTLRLKLPKTCRHCLVRSFHMFNDFRMCAYMHVLAIRWDSRYLSTIQNSPKNGKKRFFVPLLIAVLNLLVGNRISPLRVSENIVSSQGINPFTFCWSYENHHMPRNWSHGMATCSVQTKS